MDVPPLPFAPWLRTHYGKHALSEFTPYGGVLPRYARLPMTFINGDQAARPYELQHRQVLCEAQDPSAAKPKRRRARVLMKREADLQTKHIQSLRREVDVDNTLLQSMIEESLWVEQKRRYYDRGATNPLACVPVSGDDYHLYHPMGVGMDTFHVRKVRRRSKNEGLGCPDEGGIYEDLLNERIRQISTEYRAKDTCRDTWLVSVSGQREVRIYECNTQSQITRLDTLALGQNVVHTMPSPFSRECLVCLEDGTVCTWQGVSRQVSVSQVQDINDTHPESGPHVYGRGVARVYTDTNVRNMYDMRVACDYVDTKGESIYSSWVWADYLSHPMVLAYGIDSWIGLIDRRTKTRLDTMIFKCTKPYRITSTVCCRTNPFQMAHTSEEGVSISDYRMPGRCVLQWPLFPGTKPFDMISYAGTSTVITGQVRSLDANVVAFRLNNGTTNADDLTDYRSNAKKLDLLPNFYTTTEASTRLPRGSKHHPELLMGPKEFETGQLAGMCAFVPVSTKDEFCLMTMSTTGVISSRLFESSYNVPCGCHDNENVEAESESLADSFLNSDDEAYDPEEFKRLCVMDYSSVMEVMTAREHKERTAPESIFIPNSTFPDCSVDALERSFRGIAPEPAPTSTVEGSGGVGSIQRVDPNTQGLIGHPQSGTHTGDAQATVGGASTGEQVDTSPKGKEKAIVVSDLDEWDEPDTQMFHSQKRAAYHSSSQSQDNAFRDLDLDLDLDMDLDLDLELSDDDMNTQKSTAEGAKGKEKKETEEEIKKFRYPFDASVNETGVTVLMDMDKFWDKNSALQPKQAENVDAENPVIEAGTREVWVGEEWPTIEQVEYNENLTFPKRKKGAQDIVPEKVWVIKPKPPPKKKPKKNLGSQIGKHAKQRKMPTVIGHSQPKKRHGFKVSRQKKSGSSQTTSRSQTVRFADSEAQSQQQSQTQDYTQSNSQAHSRSGSQSAQSSQSQSQSQSQFESQPQSDFGSQSQSQSQSHSQYRAKGKHKKKHKKDKHKKDKHKSNKRRMGF